MVILFTDSIRTPSDSIRLSCFALKTLNIINLYYIRDKCSRLLLFPLQTNRVRTFLPAQPEILCASPAKYKDVPLKELMMRKANETMTAIGLRPSSTSNSQR